MPHTSRQISIRKYRVHRGLCDVADMREFERCQPLSASQITDHNAAQRHTLLRCEDPVVTVATLRWLRRFRRRGDDLVLLPPPADIPPPTSVRGFGSLTPRWLVIRDLARPGVQSASRFSILSGRYCSTCAYAQNSTLNRPSRAGRAFVANNKCVLGPVEADSTVQAVLAASGCEFRSK